MTHSRPTAASSAHTRSMCHRSDESSSCGAVRGSVPPHNGLAWCRAGPVADTMTQAEPGVNSRPRDCVRAIASARSSGPEWEHSPVTSSAGRAIAEIRRQPRRVRRHDEARLATARDELSVDRSGARLARRVGQAERRRVVVVRRLPCGPPLSLSRALSRGRPQVRGRNPG